MVVLKQAGLRCAFVAASLALVALVAFAGDAPAEAAAESAPLEVVEAPEVPFPEVVFKTSLGEFTLRLWPDKAPETVENFLRYVDDGFYDGLIFHRVVPRFIIQSGGYDENLERKLTRHPISLEPGGNNGAYTIAMARRSSPRSATSQFFINLRDNPSNNTRPAADGRPMRPGYCAFGEVIEGRTVIERIGRIPTREFSSAFSNLPDPLVIIESAHRKNAPAEAATEAQGADSTGTPNEEGGAGS